MSNSKEYSSKFKSFDKIPMPIFITDTLGKVLYKNELARKNYSFRVGNNIFKFADDNDTDLVKSFICSEIPSTVVLKSDNWACCCLVIPKIFDDGERYCIYSSIPYSYDFFESACVVDKNSKVIADYFDEFENHISIILSSLENKIENIPEETLRILKYNAVKLMRFEKRLRANIFPKSGEYLRMLSANSGQQKSVDLCTFSNHMCKILNSMSNIVGFGLTYVPKNSYCLSRAVPAELAKIFVYIAMFCLKFSYSNDTIVFVTSNQNGGCITFESKLVTEYSVDFKSFDFAYISACAKNLGYKMEFIESQSDRLSIKLHVNYEISGVENILSAVNTIFDVTEEYIKRSCLEAFELIGAISDMDI